MPEPVVEHNSRIRSCGRRVRTRHSPATRAGRSRPLRPSRRLRTRPAPPPSRTPATSPSETSRARARTSCVAAVCIDRGGRRAQDRQAVERIRQPGAAPRSRRRGRSRGVRDDGHPRASRLRRSPSDPWRRRWRRFTRPTRRRDDRHLMEPGRDPRRHIETRVAIAFELETVELANSRAIGREEQSPDSRRGARVPLRNPFESAIVGQRLKQPSVCRRAEPDRARRRA